MDPVDASPHAAINAMEWRGMEISAGEQKAVV
jgi:hypothetical protein